MKMQIGTARGRVAVGLATLLVGVGGGVALASHTFNDVSNGAWYHDSVDFIESRNITGGCEGGVGNKFCPDRTVTRAEMSAFILKTARALTPVVLTDTQSSLTEGTNGCIIGPFVPEYERVATFNGGLYSNGTGNVSARVQYRTNGGSWQDVQAAWYVPDEAVDGFASTPLVGYQNLEPGVSYEFSQDTFDLGTSRTAAGCQLTAVIHHRMPDGLGVADDVGTLAIQDDIAD